MSGSHDAEEAPELRSPGRLRSAWSVLRGEALVPAQIVAEWAEYQQIFNDLLQRFSASLARQAKAEKARIKALSESIDESPQQELPLNHKSAIRSRAAALHLSRARGPTSSRSLPSSLAPPPSNGSLALQQSPPEEAP